MATGTGFGSDDVISSATLEKAIRELNESPETRPQAIQELRRRIEQHELGTEHQKLLEGKRRDDAFLLRFLRARKFDINRATEMYINYHQYLERYSDILGDRHPKLIEPILKSGIVGVLDSRLSNGSKVVCIFPTRYNVDETPPAMIIKTVFLVMEKLIEDQETQVHGISIFDHLAGVSFYHVLKIAAQRQHLVRRAVVELQDVFPARLKGVHLVQPPWFVSIVLNLAWPFLKQKTKERLHSHRDTSTLHAHVGPEHLPAEFGGHLPPMDAAQTVLKLFEQELTE